MDVTRGDSGSHRHGHRVGVAVLGSLAAALTVACGGDSHAPDRATTPTGSPAAIESLQIDGARLMACSPVGYRFPPGASIVTGQGSVDLEEMAARPDDAQVLPTARIEGAGVTDVHAAWRPRRAGVALEIHASPGLLPNEPYVVRLDLRGLRVDGAPLAGELTYTVHTLPADAAGTWVFAEYTSAWFDKPRSFELYLPPGYGESPDQRYPVLHAYVGGLSKIDNWRTKGFVDVLLDEMIQSCEIEPMLFASPDPHFAGPILALPDNRFLFVGGDYVDWFDGTEHFERYLAEEFPAYLEDHYAARRDKWGHGTMGYSLAGFGAAAMAMRNPDRFGSTSPMGGFLSLRYLGGKPYRPPSEVPYWTDPYANPISLNLEGAVVVSAMRKSLGPDLANWSAHNPVELAEGLTDATFAGNILIDVGDADRYGVDMHAVDLSRVLDERGIRHILRITPDGPHDWPLWRAILPDILAFHSRAFAGIPQPSSLPPRPLLE
ncbi:MAG: hypothetical protein KC466_04550 [Myxococcales bacterium]|nr:hypothetical protein [Myxococcales bacterium]